MPERPLISATLICKDEQANVRPLLDGIWAHVDEVIVVDTGSTDQTIREFENYALEHDGLHKLRVVHHEWADDFAAARNLADSLASGEWLLWADMDDTVQGVENLRKMALGAGEQVIGFFCQYVYAQDEHGNIISELWRERLVRNDGTPWEGRLHEHKVLRNGGQIIKVDPNNVRWIHRRDHSQRTATRNLRILEAWNEEEPDNEQVLWALGMEHMAEGRPKESSDAFAGCLQHAASMQPDRVSQAVRLMCAQLMLQHRHAEAKAACFQFLGEHWNFADTHLTLSELAHEAGQPAEALLHAQTALRIGKPDTLLIVNPLQYTAHPRVLIAAALAQMGQLDEAVTAAEECLALDPGNPIAQSMLPRWRGAQRRQNTTRTVLALAEMYCQTGELAKAQRLLCDVPWFIKDQPELATRRAQVARQIAERQRAEPVVDDAATAFLAQIEVAA